MCPPTPPVWRPGSLGWAGRSSQVFRRKREGGPSKLEGPTGVEAREGQKTGQLPPRRDPRGQVRSPDVGSLERMKNSYLCRADSSGAGSALCRPPMP